jgi:hypothetical protein
MKIAGVGSRSAEVSRAFQLPSGTKIHKETDDPGKKNLAENLK